MDYRKFNKPNLDTLQPDQVAEYIDAAKPHYTYELPYHNWNHAEAVIDGIDAIADKLETKGVVVARQAFRIAAAWHDAGYHENSKALGFATKEAYSAALLEEYLQDKPVGQVHGMLMRSAIIATQHINPIARTPQMMILHRADTANIGGPADEFIENNILLWHEANGIGKPTSWDQNLAQTDYFVHILAAEHDYESVNQGLTPEDTTVDVHDTPFAETAKKNMAALYRIHEQ